MNKETLGGILLAISDGWKNFSTPTTSLIVGIWADALAPYDENTIKTAIKELYWREDFFSFSKLIAMLEDLTAAPAMPKVDVIATIKKMSTDCRQDISDRPEIIQQTIRHAGGLIKLGQRTWDQWTEKEVAAAYDEAIRVMKKPKLNQIDKAQRLRINQ